MRTMLLGALTALTATTAVSAPTIPTIEQPLNRRVALQTLAA